MASMPVPPESSYYIDPVRNPNVACREIDHFDHTPEREGVSLVGASADNKIEMDRGESLPCPAAALRHSSAPTSGSSRKCTTSSSPTLPQWMPPGMTSFRTSSRHRRRR